jgi:uncharacterized protein YndB with AHSA1/START domain
MITTERAVIAVSSTINAPVEKVWELWTEPRHIMQWNNASDDWFTPSSFNDLRMGGTFTSRMESRDGKYGFDFGGEYTKVEPHKLIEYVMGDGRKVSTLFESQGDETIVTTNFDAEETNSVEMQQGGWQAILNNFKKYVERSERMEPVHYEILINASPEKVYKTMIDQATYSQWTSVFNPTSSFKGTWEKGSEIRFFGIGEDGKEEGMVSKIRENIPNRYIHIEHLRSIRDNEGVASESEMESWSGASEKYFMKDENGATRLMINMDVVPKYRSYFDETWPKALEKVKEICERV